jgi:uncharacterized protein (TIGR02996 family)
MTEAALRAAVAAAPDDDTPRLVYADWLDEHGRPDYACFIREQIDGTLKALAVTKVAKGYSGFHTPVRENRGRASRLSPTARRTVVRALLHNDLTLPAAAAKVVISRGFVARVEVTTTLLTGAPHRVLRTLGPAGTLVLPTRDPLRAVIDTAGRDGIAYEWVFSPAPAVPRPTYRERVWREPPGLIRRHLLPSTLAEAMKAVSPPAAVWREREAYALCAGRYRNVHLPTAEAAVALLHAGALAFVKEAGALKSEAPADTMG